MKQAKLAFIDCGEIYRPKLRPILFKGEMVEAILDGSKVQTRRLITKRRQNINVGDVLWVRETYSERAGYYIYRSTWRKLVTVKWKPSIFMPKEACRLFLKVTGIRTEYLADISEEDAKKEGVLFFEGGYKNYMDDTELRFTLPTAKMSFMSLWVKINGEESSYSNPLVLVYDFKVINKPV